MSVDDLHSYNYRNITISGLPGCGSTTLLTGLKDELQFDGWKGFNGGEFMREYATEKGLFDANSKHHHDATVYSDDFDRAVDLGMREKLANESHWLLESWLSGFMAQGIEGTLKILMICSDDSVRVDRIMNRDQVSATEAKDNMHARYQKNLKKWSRLYSTEWQEWVVGAGKVGKKAQIDFWLPDLYDLVIDTYELNKEQSLNRVLDVITKKKN